MKRREAKKPFKEHFFLKNLGNIIDTFNESQKRAEVRNRKERTENVQQHAKGIDLNKDYFDA
tara:strand:- start:931 stop:1116 length:186 start_codon:yes stop_codon:yes gene_type:complete